MTMTNTWSINAIKFLGWTDEVSACDLCGKTGLKSTAALEIDGETVYYGCVCAARALSGRTGEKLNAAKIRRETEKAHDMQIKCAQAFDRGLYEREYQASIEAIKNLRKSSPENSAVAFKIGLNGLGGFHASHKVGPNKWDRIESADLNAVVEWVKRYQP